MVDERLPASAPTGDDLLVVSNREPYEHACKDGEVTATRTTGGLGTALDALLARTGGQWLAWGSGDADFDVTDDRNRVAVPPNDPGYTLHRLDLRDAPVQEYYAGFSNRVLWPVAHHEPDRVAYEPRFWDAYEAVNRRFADAVVDVADADTVVWFQDYHLARAPRLVRDRAADRDGSHGDASDAGQAHCPRALAQFWHVPWPSPGALADCPHREALLDGLLANDLLGFHTERYRCDFVACVDRFLDDATVTRDGRRVHYRGDDTELVAVPAGVDPEAVRADVDSTDATAFARDLGSREALADRVAVAVDRLDYTKGVLERLEAFEHLWETRPDRRGAVTLVQKCTPTRQAIPAYREYADRVTDRVAALNDRFGTPDWRPVVHVERDLDRRKLAGLYRLGDVCVVSSRRDGLNLVAEEYAVAADDGALVLSAGAGVRAVLGDGAIVADPTAPDEFADAIDAALALSAGERARRLVGMERSVREHDVAAWMADVFGAIRAAAPPRPD